MGSLGGVGGVVIDFYLGLVLFAWCWWCHSFFALAPTLPCESATVGSGGGWNVRVAVKEYFPHSVLLSFPHFLQGPVFSELKCGIT